MLNNAFSKDFMFGNNLYSSGTAFHNFGAQNEKAFLPISVYTLLANLVICLWLEEHRHSNSCLGTLRCMMVYINNNLYALLNNSVMEANLR